MTRRLARRVPDLRVRRRDERGATALFAAVLVSLVLLIVAAFAIDLGMQRAGRRDMQTVADMVALDMGRLIDGRTRAEIEAGSGTDPSAAAQLSWSVANNADEAVGGTPGVTAYWVEVAADGTYPEAGGSPVQVAGGDVPNGVVVVAGTDVGFAFGSITGTRGGDVQRSAVAVAEESACFRLGSYAARLDTNSSAMLDGILEGILGGGVNLDLLSYTGIADASISLLDLAAVLGVGSVDQLLSSTINAGTLLVAAADVLRADGVSNADVVGLVGAELGGISIRVGDLIRAEPGSGAAETVTVNALDLLAGTVLVANGTNAVAIPALTANLPFAGTDLTSSLTLIEKPRVSCGKRGARAETSQIALTVGGPLASPPGVLGLTPTNVSTQIAANVASARGTLSDILCGSETATDPSGMDVQVTSGAVGASLSVTMDFDGTTSGGGNVNAMISGIARLLTRLLSPVVSIEIRGSLSVTVSTGEPSTIRTAPIRVPTDPARWDDPVSTGSGDLGLTATDATVTSSPPLTVTARSLLGTVSLSAAEQAAIIDNLVSGVAGQVLNPLVGAVNDRLLHPLYDILGLTVGGADVFGQKPYCSNPELVG